MATWPNHGLVDWDDDLLTWMRESHNDDGTLKVGPGATPLAADYMLKTNGTTVTVYDSSGSEIDSANEVGSLINGLAANFKSFVFGSGVFPWSTAIDLDGLIGVSLVGQGGLQNENKNTRADRGPTQFKWTPTSGTAFTAAGTQGLRLDRICFQYTSNAYVVGDGTEDALPFFSIEGVDHSTPTRHAMIDNCFFGADSTGKLDCGGPIFDINKTVNIAVRNCLFVGGTMHLRSHHVNTSDDFANVVEFTACRFSRNKAPTNAAAGWPSFFGSGISWAFRNCHWEPSQGGPIFMHQTNIENFMGLSYEDCWIGDQSGTPAAAAAMIEWHGVGLRIVGGQMDLQDGYSVLKTNGSTCTGIIISGINIPNPDQATNGVINCASGTVKDITYANMPTYPTTVPLFGGSGLAQPPRTGQIPYKALSANTTLATGDHDRTFGVDATSGAITITLPSAACVGLTFTVKKTDSSGNAVTVARAGSDTIDGATSFSLATQYKFVRLIAAGSAAWRVVGSN